MILEMKVPSPGESISEVEIAQWLVADGDYVEKDQTIAEVDSDKATLDLPAEESGVITLKASEGDVVPVGNIVCHIDTSVKKSAKKHIEPTIPVKDDKIIEPQSNPDKIILFKEHGSSFFSKNSNNYDFVEKVKYITKYRKNFPKKIIIFSPSAASFDSFKNFEDRGSYFNKLIKKYLNV